MRVGKNWKSRSISWLSGALSLVFFLFVVGLLISPLKYAGAAHLATITGDTIYYPLLISLETSLFVVAVTVIFGLPVSLLLARKNFRGKIILDTIIDLPIFLPPLVSGIALVIMLGKNGLMAPLGLHVLFTKKGIVIAQFFVASPFFIKTVKNTIESIPEHMIQASYMLSGTTFYTFRRVILPLAKGGIVSGIVMTWARSMGEFGATAMVAGAIPGYTETMTIAIYRNASSGDLNTAALIACFLMLISFSLLFVFKKVTQRGT